MTERANSERHEGTGKRSLLVLWTVSLALTLFFVLPQATRAQTWTETEMEAPGPRGPLGGLLLLPEEPALDTLALIIPGSGPTDRDGNGPQIQTAMYQLLAQGLAEQGIASLRIDKRGLFSSAAAVEDANAVTLKDYAQDLYSWIAVAKSQLGVGCVWLVGHSEGALVALVAAAKPDDLCGLVLLASPGRPAGEVLREQMDRFAKTPEVLASALDAIDQFEAGNRVQVENMNEHIVPLFRPEIQDFLIDLLSIRPADLLEAYDGPALIVQGMRDIQVSPQDARLLKAVRPDATMVLLENTNHVLKTVESDDINANLATYGNASLPLAPDVVDSVAAFVLQHTKEAKP